MTDSADECDTLLKAIEDVFIFNYLLFVFFLKKFVSVSWPSSSPFMSTDAVIIFLKNRCLLQSHRLASSSPSLTTNVHAILSLSLPEESNQAR
jgi:hypothetical protein